MANTKEYKIVINGLTESISAVESLNKQLDALDKRINSLQSQNIKLNTSSGGKSALSEEEAIQREINKLKKEGETLDAKIVAAQDEIYKKVDATKQLYKETVADQKAMAAEERLIANTYSNTMQGMKSHLADLKAAINTTDLGDTEKISQMTKEANELSNKLKEMEQAYGQFGRNVGNYAEGVAEGLSKVKVNVGDTVREFDNAKQASKELGNELKTMAVNGQQGTKEFKDLQKAVASLNSDIKDATVSSRAMDNLLDTMQSFAAIGSVTKGFSALFGFDDTEIEKSIQKLVALQNVMQGIEKINQQMNTGEGIGGWLSKGNEAVDNLVAKLTGANKAQLALNASTTAGKTASEGLAAAETAQAAATSTATVATKALSVALKTIGIGLIISAVAYLVTYWKEIYKWFTDTIPALKNLATWFDKIKAVAMGVGSAIVNYMVQPLATLVKVIQAVINGNFSEIPKIISEGVKKTFNLVGNYQKGYYKETERQQEAHNKKMREQQKKANEDLLKDEEAKYGQSHKRTQEYLKKQMKLVDKGSDEYKELQRKLWEDERKQKEEQQKKSLSDAKKNAKEIDEAEKDLIQLRIANMKEGLNKTIKQLEEERKQKLAKVEADGKLVGERQAEINKYYDKKIEEAKKEHAENVEKTYKSMWDNIYSYSLETQRKITEASKQTFEINSQNLEYGRSKVFTDKQEKVGDISAYGIQGKNQLSLGTQTELQLEEHNNKKLVETYKNRLEIIEQYWTERKDLTLKSENEIRNQEIELENQSFRREFSEMNNHYKELNKEVKKSLSAGTIVEEQAEEIRERNRKEFQERQKALVKEHQNNLLQIQQNSLNKMQNLTAEYYRERLQELRDFQTAIANLESKQPVYDKYGWGIINLSETKKNNENLLESYRKLSDEIVKLKRKLNADLKDNKITFDDFQNANRELDTFADSVGQKMDKVKYELSLGAQIGSFIQSINQYVQAGLQAVQTVLNAVDEYNTAMLDKEQETLDKENEALDKKLDEQEDIISKHKSAIDSIEDELANSRGDRRQHLIDQLNAEMQAERDAYKEKQRLEKEEQKLKEKQDDLDRKRKEAEYHRNINSIIVSNAMAVANGYAQQPFMPVGLAMGTLALALGAVQLALAKAAKPYAFGGQLDGGQIVGNRHRDGGVKVLGGRAEVEGGEYITNRLTTAKNLDLLEYVNSKKKRIDISDMLEFYNGGRVKTSIQKVRTKFEDGGYLPVLPSNVDIKEQLRDIYVMQDQRPVVVSVVDITNKQNDVRRVQTLAGLSE